jgi:hypothetical protein
MWPIHAIVLAQTSPLIELKPLTTVRAESQKPGHLDAGLLARCSKWGAFG